MKLSIIYPTRKRFDLFVKSTDSLIQKCSDLNNLEVLVAMDDDDLDTISKREESNHVEIKKVCTISNFIYII